MSTLKKEREAIVNRLHKARLDRFGEHTTIGEDRYLKDFINEVVVPALISHEEKVMERVRNGVEGMKVWFMEEDYHNTFPLISKEDLLDNLK